MSVIALTKRRAHRIVSRTAFKRGLLCSTILAGLTMMPTDVSAATVTFDRLGMLGGSASKAYGVSDTGLVVGEAYDAGEMRKPFSWTSDDGMVSLGTFGGSRGDARALSADGSVIVGYADFFGDVDYHAFRWTEADGLDDLGTLAGGTWSQAKDVSADGSVVVGRSGSAAGERAFRWTEVDGMDDLGTLGGSSSSAGGISGDGAVIVGRALTAGNAENYAFRWTQGDGMVSLEALGGTTSVAYDVSYDGSVIVGSAFTAGDVQSHPFRWTQADGMVDLGSLGGGWGTAYAVSADGSIIVGYSTTATVDWRASYWTEANGMEDISTILTDSGVDMTDIILAQANGISPNGKYIVGEGYFNGSFLTEAFLVYYDGVTGDITSTSQQQEATQSLARNQQSMLAESRSTAGQLLGFSRPVDSRSYTYAGGMFGSAVGYTGGQFSGKGVTLLGGIGYGAQDYKNIEQDNASTIAMAGRYTFSDVFAGQKNLSPFVELGGWVTPRVNLTMSRPYGTGASVGVGTTESTSYADYARAGLTWDINAKDKLTGYGELGQQFMKFDAYAEATTASNPFPASINDGLVRMDVARAGGAWTHQVEGLTIPVAFTLAGAAAHAFAGESGMTVNTAGIGATTAAFESSTWGEFTAGVETQLTERAALNLNISGTTGGTGIGTAVHGGAGLSYKF